LFQTGSYAGRIQLHIRFPTLDLGRVGDLALIAFGQKVSGLITAILRARIILLSAARWERWRLWRRPAIEDLRLAMAERFMAEGVDGPLRDKSRPPGTAPLQRELVEQVVAGAGNA
jgi:hypothetical protein